MNARVLRSSMFTSFLSHPLDAAPHTPLHHLRLQFLMFFFHQFLFIIALFHFRACVRCFIRFFFQLSSHLISSILSTPGFCHRVQPFASSCHFLDVGIIICERFAIFFTMLVLLSNIDEMMLEKFCSISKRPLFFVSCMSFSQS